MYRGRVFGTFVATPSANEIASIIREELAKALKSS